MTYPQLNKAAHCLQAFATLCRSPQSEPSIPTTHFWSASFFCFPHSPSAFAPTKHPGFYGNKTHHGNGQSWMMSPCADPKQGWNQCFAGSARSRPKAGLKSTLCSLCQEPGRRWELAPRVCTRVSTRCPLVTPGTHMHSHRLPGMVGGSAELLPSHSALI